MARPDNPVGIWPSQDIRFARDLVQESMLLFANTPFVWAPHPPLHRLHFCAIQRFPPTILHRNTCRTVLVMAISCKGQAGISVGSVLPIPRGDEQTLVCLSNREIVDASRWCKLHCKIANKRVFL